MADLLLHPFLVLPLVASLGGIAAGLVVVRLTGGKAAGGLYGGMIGALGLYHALKEAGWEFAALGPVSLAGSFVEGGIGGALLGAILGFLMKPRA